MQNKSGLSNLNTQIGYPSSPNKFDINDKIQSVRVKDIILDDSHPNFKKYGEWNGIGTIEFEPLNVNSGGNLSTTIATPLIPYLKNYPLVNEIILVFKLTNRNLSEVNNSFSFYYLNALNLWNHPHHNAYPNAIHSVPESQLGDYTSITEGSTSTSPDDIEGINLNSPRIGGTFVEKTNIHPILPFAGDVIFEGRFGNSIRLGSTSKSKSNINNNWSEGKSKNGDPITIIRNGQPISSNEEGWVPITENINKDLSSIYLTSTQKIPLLTPITNFPSITTTKPTSISSYDKEQMILNSGRLVFNSNKDHILFNSLKSTSLSSIEDIGLYSRNGNINLKGNNIKLGDINASQSLILGDDFTKQFSQLLSSLSLLMDSLSSEPTLKLASLSAQNSKIIIDSMIKQLPDLLSKITKTS